MLINVTSVTNVVTVILLSSETSVIVRCFDQVVFFKSCFRRSMDLPGAVIDEDLSNEYMFLHFFFKKSYNCNTCPNTCPSSSKFQFQEPKPEPKRKKSTSLAESRGFHGSILDLRIRES